jgi:trimeric autotransporter adhesin
MRLKQFLIPVLAVLACFAASLADAAQYTYDQLGRVTSVIEADGSSISYTYDANGNITSITRTGATLPLSILSFSPASGAVGSSVIIRGTGFSTVAGQNALNFNGVPAAVTGANASTIVATVPAGATTGPISVSVAGNTASSSSSFTVATLEITGFTPTIGAAGTQVLIDGSGFDPVPGNNVVRFNTSTATVSAASTTQLTVNVPAGATSGHVSVTAPAGSAASASDFIVPPPNTTAAQIAMAGRIAPAGAGLVFTVNETNKVAVALFDGMQGQRLTLVFTNVNMSGYFFLYAPDGTQLTWSGFSSGITTLDLGPLAQTGTYAFVMKPTSTAGSATIRVVPEALGTLQTDGTALPMSLVSGQNASLSFNAVGGESYNAVLTNYSSLPVGYSMTASVLKPDGTVLSSCSSGITEGLDGCHFWIPTTGTYTLRLDPYGFEVTSFDARLNTDFRATLVNGSPIEIALDRRGRNALLTFDVASGQAVTLNLASIVTSPANKQLQLRVYNASGTQVQTQWSSGGNNTLNLYGLAAGTYTALVVPDDAVTATFTANIAAVTPVPLSANGATTAASAVLPGQTLYFTFAGTQAQNLSLGLTDISFASGAAGYPWIQVLRPDGYQLTTANCSTTPGRCQIPMRNLPATGTYRIEVVTSVIEKTNVSATLSQSVGGTLTIGTPLNLTLASTGQNAVLTFTNPSQQTLALNVGSLNLSPAGSSVTVRVFNAGGSQVSYASSSSTASAGMPNLASGTYTATIDPITAATGTMQALLTQGTPVAADGTAVNFNASGPGEKGYFTFSGTAGQNLGLGLTGLTLNPGSPNYVYVRIFRPDGSQFAYGYCYTSDSGCQIPLRGLPTTGTYRIEVEAGATQTMGFSLRLTAATGGAVSPSNTPITVSFGTPGQHAEYTFTATTGQNLALRLASSSMTPANSQVYLRVFNSSGTQAAGTYMTSTASTVNLTSLVAGTYSVSITPTYAATGSIQFTLAEGLGGTIASNGATSNYSSAVPGQNGYFSFEGTAGQNLGLGITGLSLAPSSPNYLYFRVMRPDGNQVAAGYAYTTDNGLQLDLRNLPSTGTYRVLAESGTQQTMSFGLTLSQSTGGAITPSVTPLSATFGVAGQSALYTFTATAGQAVAIRLASPAMTPANNAVNLRVYNPSGTQIAYSTITTTPTTVNLPNLVAGTYSVLLVPIYAATGTVSVTVAPGLGGSITSNGSGNNFSSGVAGQNGYFTFSGTAGENLGLGLTALTLTPGSPGYAYLRVFAPDGSQLSGVWCYTTNTGCQVPLRNLPATGTYRIQFDPDPQQTMSFTLTLSQAVTGTLAGGTPLPITLSVPGQVAVVTFTATAGQSIPLTIGSPSLTPSGNSAQVWVYNPAGSAIQFVSVSTSPVTLNLTNLTAGTYTVLVAPTNAATGSLQLSRP